MEKFRCPECGSAFPVDDRRWRCSCGSYLDLETEARFPVNQLKGRPATLWRYQEALPVAREAVLSMGEGCTPMEEVLFQGRRAILKIDYLFPTGSYKDRGATVLVSKLRELGVKKVVEDSSGNAGCAIAAYCARGGIRCGIYVPASTSPGKLAQIETYGADLHKIDGSRERTAEVTMAAAAKTYYASHCWNPYFLQGTKTFAFEVWEQLGWKAPDALVLPVGHGTLFLGAYLGFRELKEAGRIRRIPRLIGVQSARCSPLAPAFRKGEEEAREIEKGETVAEGIAIARPVRGKQILRALYETGGEIVTVTDREVRLAWREMGRRGHFIEPTSAATVAGLKKVLAGAGAGRRETVVSTLTGTGLKAAGKMG